MESTRVFHRPRHRGLGACGRLGRSWPVPDEQGPAWAAGLGDGALGAGRHWPLGRLSTTATGRLRGSPELRGCGTESRRDVGSTAPAPGDALRPIVAEWGPGEGKVSSTWESGKTSEDDRCPSRAEVLRANVRDVARAPESQVSFEGRQATGARERGVAGMRRL